MDTDSCALDITGSKEIVNGEEMVLNRHAHHGAQMIPKIGRDPQKDLKVVPAPTLTTEE